MPSLTSGTRLTFSGIDLHQIITDYYRAILSVPKKVSIEELIKEFPEMFENFKFCNISDYWLYDFKTTFLSATKKRLEANCNSPLPVKIEIIELVKKGNTVKPFIILRNWNKSDEVSISNLINTWLLSIETTCPKCGNFRIDKKKECEKCVEEKELTTAIKF